MKKLLLILSTGSLLFQLACSGAAPGDNGNNTQKYLTYTIVYLSAIWQKVTVADVPGFYFENTDGKSLTPSCACPPSYQATTNKTTAYNPEFAFFVRRGSVNNLLIFFMGGGACWDITNCAYNHTYSEQLIESNLLLGLGATGFLEGQGVGGIMDTTEPNNPFKDWTIVWIPYCTADLGVGQKDYDYPDHYRNPATTPDPVYPNDLVTIRHRGLVNVKLVLKWLENNIIAPDKLFVTGVSAGSYSAVMNFPLIRNLYNSTSTRAYVLGDAGVGVTGVDNDGDLFLKIVGDFDNESNPARWGLELPSPVFDGETLGSMGYSYKQLFQTIVDYYKLNYPNDRFAQYTTKWDKTQVWFYNIQDEDNISNPGSWGSESGASPTLATSTKWKNFMMPPNAIDISGTNYWYYIGEGTDHTIMAFPKFYTETSGGYSFAQWVSDFVNDQPMSDHTCTDCDAP